MKNLIMTTALTVGLLIPGISFAGNIFGVDKELTMKKDNVESNLIVPTHIADGLDNTLVPQELEENSLEYGINNYDEASYIFGVKLDSENIG